MVRIYYHYSNGCRRAGSHCKLIDRSGAKGWIRWMEENMDGFVFDKIEY